MHNLNILLGFINIIKILKNFILKEIYNIPILIKNFILFILVYFLYYMNLLLYVY